VDDALACLGRHPASDGITLELSIPADLTAAIRPVALQHVVLNLVLNSRNAMIPRGGVLTIHGEQAGDRVVVSVRDTGKGMTSEQLERLFTPFAAGRSGLPCSGGHKSTGLGMTICKRLVEDAGGTLRVESRVGVGTDVMIVLRGS
jgi:signal transduction histidine kinase